MELDYNNAIYDLKKSIKDFGNLEKISFQELGILRKKAIEMNSREVCLEYRNFP